MNLEFRKPVSDDAQEITNFKAEFQKNGMGATGTLFRLSAEEWLEHIKKMENGDKKGYLVDFGGHLGYSVRPSERRKGYAKTMLKAALDICKNNGIEKVLITCLEDNIASAKTIESCGGILEQIIYDDVSYKANMKRYWISL